MRYFIYMELHIWIYVYVDCGIYVHSPVFSVFVH